MKKFLFTMFAFGIVLVASSTCRVANADLIMTGLTASENFDGLPTANSTAFFSATVGTQTAITGTSFVGTKVSGTGATGASLFADTGAGNGGGIYSYGAAASTERALGAIASGTNVMAFGVEIVNNSGSIFEDITVSFTQEVWRSSTANVNTLVAAFSTSSTSATFLTDAVNFTSLAALNVVGPAPVAANGALNGNDPANQAARTFTFTGINLADGGRLFVRWTDSNEAGNDAGLAIDNFSVVATTAVAIPEPTSALALAGLGIACVFARRRAA